jgi:hypothetical protein
MPSRDRVAYRRERPRPHPRRLNAIEVGLALSCCNEGFPRLQGGPRAFMARGVGCRGALRQPERGHVAGPVARAVIAPGIARHVRASG